MAILALLMVGTSWAVASWVSAWLVLPYLLLMALLLSPSTGRQPGEPASEGSDASDHPRSARPAGGFDDPDSSTDDLDSSGLPEDGSESEQGAESKPARARRGKGRVKKAKAAPEPSEATWVQVAPGKFVRVEAADESTGQAGPHSRVGTPAEVPSTPQPLEFEEGEPFDRTEDQAEDEAPQGSESDAWPEVPLEEVSPLEGPIEDAGPAFDPVEGPEGDPTGAVESGFSTALEESETAGSPGTFEGTSAADGNAPQVVGSFESPEARTPDALFKEAVEDLALVVESVEESEDEDDPSSSLEDPQPLSLREPWPMSRRRMPMSEERPLKGPIRPRSPSTRRTSTTPAPSNLPLANLNPPGAPTSPRRNPSPTSREAHPDGPGASRPGLKPESGTPLPGRSSGRRPPGVLPDRAGVPDARATPGASGAEGSRGPDRSTGRSRPARPHRGMLAGVDPRHFLNQEHWMKNVTKHS